MVRLEELDGGSTSLTAGGSASSAAGLVASGNARFVDEEYGGAIEMYSKALELDPSNAMALTNRAAAHQKLGSSIDALEDVNKAIRVDPSYAMAYMRKGRVCFDMKEYTTALAAFQKGSSIEASRPEFGRWIRKCQSEIEAEATTSVSEPSSSARVFQPSHQASSSTMQSAEQHSSAPALAPRESPKYRHVFYQTPSSVTVEILAKGVKEESVKVEVGAQVLNVCIDKGPSGGVDSTVSTTEAPPYTLFLRLFGKVKPGDFKLTVSNTKVSVRLTKAEQIQWTELEAVLAARAKVAVPQPMNTSKVEAESVKSKYPSSSHRARDWNVIEREVKEEEKNEKLEGDAALTKLFQDIYKDADEDTRRAMNKSFLESKGTVLSTNWKEVGQGKVDMKE